MNDKNTDDRVKNVDELSDQSLEDVNGGAFDAYLKIDGEPPPPKP